MVAQFGGVERYERPARSIFEVDAIDFGCWPKVDIPTVTAWLEAISLVTVLFSLGNPTRAGRQFLRPIRLDKMEGEKLVPRSRQGRQRSWLPALQRP